MASAVVKTAVAARLTAGFTRCVIYPTNVSADTPADGAAYVVVQYPLARETHVGMAGVGNRTFREEGTIRFVLHVPRGTDENTAETWLDEIRALFRAAQFGGVTTWAPSPAVTNDGNETGTYYAVSASVEYFYDLLA